MESIKERAPGSIIFLLDSSPQPVEQEKVDTLKPMVDYYVSLFNHTHSMELSNKGLKSPAECYIMTVAIDIIRNMNFGDINRIFKITGRAELSDRFHIEDYDKQCSCKHLVTTKNVERMSLTTEPMLKKAILWFDCPKCHSTMVKPVSRTNIIGSSIKIIRWKDLK